MPTASRSSSTACSSPATNERPDDAVDRLLVVDGSESIRRGTRARDEAVEAVNLIAGESGGRLRRACRGSHR
jgi:hypothetical protein